MVRKKIAIIGGGVSGLIAIKTCLDEDLEPFCFERADKMGGLWRYEEKATDGQSSVMKSTVINTSKEVMAFSDFLIPEDWPNYMHNSKIMNYFHMYAKKFDLLKHMTFNQEILSCTQAVNFETTGRWVLRIKDKSSRKERVEEYDAVFVATGHHADKKLPDFPGMDIFQGQQLHAHDYRTYPGFEDKTVIVVGIGNSGLDTVVELSRVGKQAYLSTRRGAWILSRTAENGIPWDVPNTRFANLLTEILPESWTNSKREKMVEKRFNHEMFSLRPEHRFNGQHPSMSDELPTRIITGDVIVKPDIKKLTKTGVEFVDGTTVDNVDLIVYATGYVFGFPFLQKGVIDVDENNQANLYKLCCPPDLKHPTLAAIGFIQPLGAIMPIAELQCRWLTRVIKGISSLPSSQDMWKDIQQKRDTMSKRYVKSTRHTIQVDWIPYMNELADLVGCKPNLFKLMLTDPVLAWTCFFGTCTPYQYRLMGPLPWKGAREAIMSTWDRVQAPLKTRPVTSPADYFTMLRYFAVIAVILAVICHWFC